MKIVISAALLAAAIGVAPFLYLGWFQAVAAGEDVYVFNRFYGTVRRCNAAGCQRLDNY